MIFYSGNTTGKLAVEWTLELTTTVLFLSSRTHLHFAVEIVIQLSGFHPRESLDPVSRQLSKVDL